MAIETRYPHLVVDEQGQLKIEGTRIKVRFLIELYKAGNTPEQIQKEYDFLTLAQIHSALAYYYDHQEQVDEQIAESEAEYERLRAAVEPEQRGLREKLLKRLEGKR